MARTVKQDPVKQLIIDTIERLVDELYAAPEGSDKVFLQNNLKASLISKVRNADLTSDEEITVAPPVVDETSSDKVVTE